MRISIVGAGWVGCHLASRLRSRHQVDLYDSGGIFSGSSMTNQNRLHLGFHYARNSHTREMCRETFERFRSDYGEVLSHVDGNVYAVPERDSLLDLSTYMSIFDHERYSYELCCVPELVDVEGALIVPEMRIDAQRAKSMFEEELSDLLRITRVDDALVGQISDGSDLVINCTNNLFRPITDRTFYEVAVMLKYNRKRQTSFGALTMVDGRLFSIFPCYDGSFTLSSVEYTPVAVFESVGDLAGFSAASMDERSMRLSFESLVLKFYPGFYSDFDYCGVVTSVKAKTRSESSDRSPVVRVDGNVVSCFTGKIQGIYRIEDRIRGML